VSCDALPTRLVEHTDCLLPYNQHDSPIPFEMRQGSILAFLQPQIPAADNKQSSGAITITAVAAQSPPAFESDSEYAEGSHDTHRHEARRLSQAASSTKVKDNTLDPRAAIVKVAPSHVDRLKSITTTLLPVRYSVKFFTECLEPKEYSVISFVALYDSQVVGWIRCRMEPFPDAENEVYQQIYVQVLGILAPFRGIGLATELLKAVIAEGIFTYPKVRSIYAHVWESNEDALAWYAKLDFRRTMLQPQYYRRLKPSGAWVVRKELE